MISRKVLEELIQRAAALPHEDRLGLIARLEEMTGQPDDSSQSRYSWKEVCGIAPYPLLGEDAQQWVSSTRQEGDEQPVEDGIKPAMEH